MADPVLIKELFDSINANQNPLVPLTPDNVIVSDAVPVGDGSTMTVRLRGVQNRGYNKKTLEVSYAPLSLTRLFGGTYTPKVTLLSQSTLHRLLPTLNEFLGLKLTPTDVEDIELSSYGQQVVVDLTVTAKSTSTFYTGSVDITLDRRWLLLEEVVDQHLPSFQHPDPVIAGRDSVGLLTWGLDFTSIRHFLGVDETAANFRGAFADMDGLKEQLRALYGIPDWPDNRDSNDPDATLRVFNTEEVDRANPNFQKVIVQTGINYNKLLGTAYFHYNE